MTENAPLKSAEHAPDERVLQQLKSVVGEAGYFDDIGDTDAYCKAWREDWHGKTPLVLRPASTQQVSDIVKLCAEHNVAIVPQSGRTGLTGASQPHEHGCEVIINLERMTQIREIDTLNDTVTVDAGVILKSLQDIASENDRLFPLSLAAEGSCRIGGNLSTNAGGVQVLRYGNARNLVLGLEVVLPNGDIWDGLRGLRKDNTGYDLKHLFIGGEGTLGIITGAVLRLFPKPTETQVACAGMASAAQAVDLLSHMRGRLGEQITSFELMQRRCYDFVFNQSDTHSEPLNDRHAWYVLIEVANQGAPGSLFEPLAEALAEAAENEIIADAVVASSSLQAAALFGPREDMAEVQKRTGASIKHDISVPISKIPDFLERADAGLLAAFPDIRPLAFGHVGDGNLHYNPMQPENVSGEEFKKHREQINRIVHDLVDEYGGSISAEHGLGRLRRDENARYKSPIEMDMMYRIKQALDPGNIMNPGKLLPPR